MGKKRSAVIGSQEEEAVKAEKAVKREQKKLREGRHDAAAKPAKAPGLKGGQRVVDTSAESLAEYAKVQEKLAAQPSPSAADSSEAPSAKPKKVRVRSKAYQSHKSHIDPDKTYSLAEGLQLLRKVSQTKFDSTVELHLILRTSPTAKLSVSLPHAFGKPRIVAVATDEVLKTIETGKVYFDVLVASPAQMAKLVKFAKVLGPRGLMPNPKAGTVSDKPEDTAKKLAADTTTFLKLDKSGPVIHTSIGKLSFKDKQLEENISAVLSTVPGNLRKVVLKSTMSPAIKLQV